MNLSLSIENMIAKNDKTHPFSGAVLVEDQGMLFERGYGYANRSDRIKNTPNTRFGIASGCKVFTSTAICQLVQDGVLAFDTYLKDCVDVSFPNFDAGITIHHLLTHTSGIPDYYDEESMGNFESLWKDLPMYNIRSPEDFLPLFQNERMSFSPGERFSYNDAGFIVLGLVVESLTGMRFTEYVEKNIFQRCGMSDSGYYRLDQLPERTAIGYIGDEHSWRSNIYSVPIIGGPDGGAFTTVRDLRIFWDALLNHQLLTPEYTSVLLTPHAQHNENTYYGYGVWILKMDGAIFKYFVMGSDPGVSMQSSVYANGRIHAHVISNTDYGAWKLAEDIDGFIGNREL